MLKSSSLDNWDGKLSNSEPTTTQNTTIGGLKTSKDQSDPPATSSEVINNVFNVGPAFSNETTTAADIEASKNLTNATDVHGLQEGHFSHIMGPSSLMNIPSFALTVPITPRKEVNNASKDASTTTRKFLPADSPLLRAFHEYNASPSNRDLAKRLEAALSGTTLPRANNVMDTISIYSMDAEGEDEDETDDCIVAQSLLLPFSPSKPEVHSNADPRPASPSEHNSLFTPPPSGDYPSAEFLFTPPPPSRKKVATSSKAKAIMSHVEIPLCPYPKSSYKWLHVRPIQRKSRVSGPVKVHMSLGAALQASMSHNDSLGVISPDSNRPKNKKQKRHSDSYPKILNAVAGPSSEPTIARSSSISNDDFTKRKRRVHEDDHLKITKKKHKITHVDIDLTLSDNEELRIIKKPPLALPKPKPLAKEKSKNARYLESQPLVLGIVKPLPVDIWSLNTRFMRNQLKNSMPLSLPQAKKHRNPRSRLTPGFLPLSAPPCNGDDGDAMSLGDPIPTSWDADFDDDLSDDDLPLITLSNKFKRSSQPVSNPSTIANTSVSRKIDLAALYRNKDKLKTAKAGPTKTKSPTELTRLKPSTSNSSLAGQPIPLEGPSQSLSSVNNSSSGLHQDEENPLIPLTPSAKALGKRRAISPPPFIVTSQSASSHRLSAHDGIVNQEFDNFIHDYSVSSSPNHQQPQPYINGLTLSAGYSPSIQPSSLLSPFQPDSSLEIGPENFHSMTGVDPFVLQAQQTPFWSSLEGSITEYQYTTVDPTLLGGTPVIAEEPSEKEQSTTEELGHYMTEFEDPLDVSDIDTEEDRDAQSGPVAGPSSTNRDRSVSKESSVSTSASSSTSNPASPSAYTPTINPALPSSTLWKKRVSRTSSPSFPEDQYEQQPEQVGSESEYLPSAPSPKRDLDIVQYKKKGRHTSPSTTSYDPEALSENEYASSTASNHEASVAVGGKGKEKGKQREGSPATAVRILPKRQRVPKQRLDMVDINKYLDPTDNEDQVVSLKSKEREGKLDTKDKVLLRPGPKTKINWPTCEELAYCHQCRTKSAIVKMVCSKCRSVYCFRCVTTRYPDAQFVEVIDGCPRCNSYCNCTACCQRRGEEYIGPRQKKHTEIQSTLPARTPRPRVPPVVTVQDPILYDPATMYDMKVMPKDVEYFATVYDFNGKRIAVTYAPSGGEEGSTPPVVFAQGTGNQHPEAVKKTTRTFVGKVQRCWGLGKNPIIKEVKPLPKPKKAHKNGVVRTFVGRADFLRFPRRQPEDEDEDEDDDDEFGDISSLTSLTDSEEGTGDREHSPSIRPALETLTLPVP